jgi:hypothetical protein
MKLFLDEKKLFAASFASLVALHLVLVFTSRLFPFTDLPDHLAAATVARHIGEPGSPFAELYRVETGLRPNTAHMLFCALRTFPSVESANRALLALYAALLPLSVLLIIRKLGGNPWYSLLSFPLLYNYNASWGFMGFTLASFLVLLFHRLFVIDGSALGSSRRAALAALWLAGMYFVHILAALFALLVLFAGAPFAAKRSWRAPARCLLAALPLLILTLRWWHAENLGAADPGLGRFLASYYRGEYLAGLADRRHLFVFDNYHLRDGWPGYAIALVFSLGILLAAGAAYVIARRRLRASTGDAAVENGRASSRRKIAGAAPLLVAALLCCLVLPNGIPRQPVLYERFSVFLFLGLVVAGGALAGRRLPRPAIAAFVALAILHGALWAEHFAAFNRENERFDAAFLRGPSGGGRLAGLVYDYRFRGRPAYIHFPSYYTVWERGAATAKFADFRFGAVRRLPGGAAIPHYLEWVGKFGAYDGRYAGMELLLTRGVVPDGRALEGFDHIRDSGKWSLFEKRGAPAPPGRPNIP